MKAFNRWDFFSGIMSLQTLHPNSSSIDVFKCKSCKFECKSLKQHLNKAKECKANYSESDMKDVEKMLKEIAKAKKKQLNTVAYQRNQEEVIKKRAEYYDKNKSKVKEYNKSHYSKNRKKYAEKRGQYYLKNKDHHQAKAKKRKEKREEQIRLSFFLGHKKKLKAEIASYEQEASCLNNNMKHQFIFTRSREMKLLNEIGISDKMNTKFEDIMQRLEEVHDSFETQIFDLINCFNFEIDLSTEYKECNNLHDEYKKKFERLLPIKFNFRACSYVIKNEFKVIYEEADTILTKISQEMERPLSYSQTCNGFTGYTYMHFEDEVFPGKCEHCSGMYELKLKIWRQLEKNIAELPFIEKAKKRMEFVRIEKAVKGLYP